MYNHVAHTKVAMRTLLDHMYRSISSSSDAEVLETRK